MMKGRETWKRGRGGKRGREKEEVNWRDRGLETGKHGREGKGYNEQGKKKGGE